MEGRYAVGLLRPDRDLVVVAIGVTFTREGNTRGYEETVVRCHLADSEDASRVLLRLREVKLMDADPERDLLSKMELLEEIMCGAPCCANYNYHRQPVGLVPRFSRVNPFEGFWGCRDYPECHGQRYKLDERLALRILHERKEF